MTLKPIVATRAGSYASAGIAPAAGRPSTLVYTPPGIRTTHKTHELFSSTVGTIPALKRGSARSYFPIVLDSHAFVVYPRGVY